MAIDPEVEQCFNPRELSGIIRQRMKLVRHHKTIREWMHKGVKGVKLEKVNIGGEICSSIEAVKRFFVEIGKEKNVVEDVE